MSSSRSAKRLARASVPDRLGWGDVLASITDGVVVLDAAGRVLDLNPAAELLTDVSASQAVGREAAAVLSARQPNPWLEELIQATLAESVAHRCSEETLQGSRREVVVAAACAPVLDANGTLRGAVLVLHDLTMQHTLATARRHAEQLTAISTVTAGLAHEIRNPLGGIKGAAQLLRAGLTEPDQVRCTDLIIREVDRVSALVEQLRTLDTPPTLELESVNIHRVLNDVIDLERQAPAWGGITLVTEFDPSLPPVVADRALLLQVFLNLTHNAVEAVTGEGTITIATRMDSGYRVREGRARTHFIAVTITDTGPGIAEADVPRLFAPFFTTKQQGTGLGLALCQRIVAQHGGTIAYETPSRGGARFRVTLRASEDDGSGIS